MNLFIELFANLYDAFIGVVFVTFFTKHKLVERKWLSLFATALIFSVSTVFYFIDDFMLLHSAIILLILFLYSLYLNKSFNLRTILSPIIYELVIICSSTLIVLSLSNLLNLDLSAISYGVTFPRCLFLILCKLVITFALVFIGKFFNLETKFKPIYLILYLLSPLVTILTFYTFISMSLNGNIEKYYILMAVSSMGLIIENLLAIFFFTRYSKSEQEKTELELLSKLSDTEAKRYSEVERLYDCIRFMRHDIKEQLLYAEQLVENGEIEKAKNHIKNIESNVEKTYDLIHTGNRVIDNIIYSNISLHKDIQFVVTGMLNDLSFIDDIKLVSLFGNMIDNAVEYVSKQEDKVIEITFSFVSGYQNIACKNPIVSSVIDSNPTLKTTKKEFRSHGYGIKSMKNIVKSIDGMIEFYEKNNYFICHIAIPVKE